MPSAKNQSSEVRALQSAKYQVIYTLKNGREVIQPVYSDTELMHERESAEREMSDPKSHVRGYRVSGRNDRRPHRQQ